MFMSQTDDIKQRLDIVDLVGEYVKLKPAGGSNFKALCPFHHEKTPSFNVSREKQLWYCFGCAKGGDAFKFVMEIEGVEFQEALAELAEKTGVEITRFTSENINQRARLLALLDLAARFYQVVLLEGDGAAPAREYLVGRGLTDELMRKFQLGYAPDRWDSLVTFQKKKGYREAELIQAGLAIQRQDGSGIYDRFRGRITFPIHDVRGKVVGFSGRLLDESREEGKYINTPQTPVYNKSQVLYGLHLAKTAIKASSAVVMVEGNMDVIASHKANVEAVVASSGTALTREQITLLRRFTDNLLMCFDADLAGENAAKRGIDLALEEGMNVKVIRLALAKDPDEMVRRDPAAWRRAIAGATDVMTYYFEQVFREGAPHEAAGKKRAGKLLLPEIARLQDPIERAHWLAELATRLDVSAAVLQEAILKLKKNPDQRSETRDPRNQNTVLIVSDGMDRRTRLAEAFIALLFAKEELVLPLTEFVRPEDVPPPYHALYTRFVGMYHENQKSAQGGGKIFATLRQNIAQELPDLLPVVDKLALVSEGHVGEDMARLREEGARIGEALHEFARREARETLARELHEAEGRGDAAKVEELARRFSELI